MRGTLPARIQTVAGALWADGRGWVLVFVGFGWALSVGTRYIFPVLFPYLRDAFGVRLVTLGTLYSLFWVAYAIGQFPGGALADRFGERNILVISTALSSCTLIVLGLSFDIAAVGVGMVLYGLSSALFGTTRYTVLTDVYPDYDGTAIGLTQAVGEVGNAVLPVVAGLLAVYLTWRAGIVYVIPLFVIVAIGLWTVVPPRTSEPTSAVDDLSFDTLRYVVSQLFVAPTLKLTVIMALTMFVIQGVTSFYPTYLIDVKGVSSATASTLYGLLFVSAAVVMPLFGAIADTFDSRLTMSVAIGTHAVALLLVPLASDIYQLVVVTLLVTSVYGIASVLISLLTNSFPTDMKGSGLGLVRTCYFLFAATGPILVGTLADLTLFDESFFVLAIPIVAAFVLTLSLSSPNGAE